MVSARRRVTYKLLAQQFDRDVIALQRSCPHKRWGDWAEEWWAVGHSTGQKVRHCVVCNVKQYKPRVFSCPKCKRKQHRVLFQEWILESRLCDKCLSKQSNCDELKKFLHREVRS